MSKEEFLLSLRKGLSGLPQKECEERLMFYSEMIDDRMEEGFSEEEAVSAAGPVDEIIARIIADTPITKLIREKIRPKRTLHAFEIVLLILGSPIWLSLLIAAAAVILALYIVIWFVIVSLWAVTVSIAVCVLAGMAAGVLFAVKGRMLAGLAVAGAGIACAGLSVFAFYGCRAAAKGILRLTGKLAGRIKKRFMKKEETA